MDVDSQPSPIAGGKSPSYTRASSVSHLGACLTKIDGVETAERYEIVMSERYLPYEPEQTLCSRRLWRSLLKILIYPYCEG